MKWKNKTITELDILSKAGAICRIETGVNMTVRSNGKKVNIETLADGSIEFQTTKGSRYKLLKI